MLKTLHEMNTVNNYSKCYKLLGIEIQPLTIFDLNNLINYLINNPQKRKVISSQNLHSVYIFHKDPKMREFNKYTYKRIDGMPLIILGKILGYPLTREHRVTWVDYMEPFLKNVVNNRYKIFYLGSKPGDVCNAITILRNKYRPLKIEYNDGYFNKEKDSYENKQIIQNINVFNPDILLIGMGMPRQEHWVYDNIDEINANVILTCGAAMEYIAGVTPTPPRWMGRAGLEWLFRFLENPMRFWIRYFVEPWFLIPLVVRDLLSIL